MTTQYPDWIGDLKDDPEYHAELAVLRVEMTDPVVAAITELRQTAADLLNEDPAEWAYRYFTQDVITALDDALPLARAQAALVAADVELEDACEPGVSATAYKEARRKRHVALAEYRRALEAK